MAPDSPIDDVVDLKGASNLLGVPLKTLRRWREEGKLPQPDGVLGQAHIWLKVTLEDWFAEVGRPKRGRPRAAS